MRSPSIVRSALAARMLFIIPLITGDSFATNTTSVQDGDTFLDIAHSAGIPVESLEAANPGVVATGLYVGQVITIPVNNEPATGKPASTPVSLTPKNAALTTLATSASPPVNSNPSSSTLSSSTTPSSSSSIAPSTTSTNSLPSSTPPVTSTTPPAPPSSSVPPSTTASSTPNCPPTSSICRPSPTGPYVDATNVQSETNAFCNDNGPELLESMQLNNQINLQKNAQPKGYDGQTNQVGYNMSVTVVPSCSVPDASVMFPLGVATQYNCTTILYDSWKTCYNNKGMGGSITAGCFVYSFDPDP